MASKLHQTYTHMTSICTEMANFIVLSSAVGSVLYKPLVLIISGRGLMILEVEFNSAKAMGTITHCVGAYDLSLQAEDKTGRRHLCERVSVCEHWLWP